MHCRRPLQLAILSLSALTLAGCVTSQGKLSVDLQAIKECQRLGGPVAVPEISGKSDYRSLAAESLGQLNKANKGAVKRSNCEDKVVKEYAKAAGN